MQNPGPAPVVVAVHGTAAGLAATRLGAREAVARGAPLRVLHAFSWPGRFPVNDPPDYAAARQDAQQMVNEAVETALRSAPGVHVTGLVTDGDPVRVVLRQSRTAALLVLGDDGLDPGARLLPDSVLARAVTYAHCAVVVARSVRPPSGPLLAAVDGSPASRLVLETALAEALRRDLTVRVAHVVTGAGGETSGQRLLDIATATFPDTVRAKPLLLTGEPGAALVRASHTSRMVIAGPRGADGSTALGPVAWRLLRSGACPTLFVHGTPADDGPTDGTVPSTGALIG